MRQWIVKDDRVSMSRGRTGVVTAKYRSGMVNICTVRCDGCGELHQIPAAFLEKVST